jgi:hypothetical protein
MATKTVRSRDKFLEALDSGYGALMSIIEATEARGDRVSRTLLAEARKAEKELLALTRGWVDSPASVFDNLDAMIDAQARAQRRTLALAREALDGAGAYRAEVRAALRQMMKANRAAGDVTLGALREVTARTAEQANRLPRLRPVRRRAVRPARVPVSAGEAHKLAG